MFKIAWYSLRVIIYELHDTIYSNYTWRNTLIDFQMYLLLLIAQVNGGKLGNNILA